MPVSVKAVKISDKFWAPKLKIYREKTIDHSWQYVNGSVEEFKSAATPEKKPVRNGKWMEANLHKVLETAAYALALTRIGEAIASQGTVRYFAGKK